MENIGEKPALHEEREQSFIDLVLKNSDFVCPYANGIEQTQFAHLLPFDFNNLAPLNNQLAEILKDYVQNSNQKKHLVLFYDYDCPHHDVARLIATYHFIEMSVAGARICEHNDLSLDTIRQAFIYRNFEAANDPTRTVLNSYIDLPEGQALFSFAMGPLFPYNNGHNPHPRHLPFHAMVCTNAAEITKVHAQNPLEISKIKSDTIVRMLYALNPQLKTQAGRHLLPNPGNEANLGELISTLPTEDLSRMSLVHNQRTEIGLYPEETWVTVFNPDN